MLEKFKDCLLIANQKLSTPISLNIYTDAKGALFKQGDTVSKITLEPSEKTVVYLAPIPDDK